MSNIQITAPGVVMKVFFLHMELIDAYVPDDRLLRIEILEIRVECSIEFLPVR